MSRTRLLPRLENLPGLTNLRKTTCQGGFFVSSARDYDATERISRGSYPIPLPPKGKPAPLHDTISLKKIIEPIDFNN
ncbi:hypothetical protein ACUL24_004912, partial [Escherichia coli]